MQNAVEKGVMDPSGFVVLADYVPGIIQEIRYYSTYNFIGDRIDGYEEPCALLTVEAARALKEASMELSAQGCRLKVFDAYRPACAVKQFVLVSERIAYIDRAKELIYETLNQNGIQIPFPQRDIHIVSGQE